ncbi:MAG: acyl-CoA thioesterase [Candidatus Kapaibacteriota bacterium]
MLRVYYADVDKMGIVYNGNYLRYFEIGRTELMRHFGIPYSLVEEQGYLLPLIEANIKWKASARYDDIIEIQTSFYPDFLNPKVRFDYVIKTSDKIIAYGYTIHTFVRSEDFRPVRTPKFFLDKIEQITIQR